MTFEINGFLASAPRKDSASAHAHDSGPWSPHYLVELARAHEQAGFDRVLVPHGITFPDSFAAAERALHNTERLKVLIAHRPALESPSTVARRFATLEHYFPGRVSIHLITGDAEGDIRRDGDVLDRDTRYARTAEFARGFDEYLYGDGPIDFHGDFYTFAGEPVTVRPSQRIPVSFAGESAAARRVGGAFADVWAAFAEPVQTATERIELLTGLAAEHDRTIGFSYAFHPILGDTNTAAWHKAEGLRDRLRESIARNPPSATLTSAGSNRVRDLVRDIEVSDENLWFGLTRLPGAHADSGAPVGTADEIVDLLLKFVDIGVRWITLSGHEGIDDVRTFGEELIPRLRERAQQRIEYLATA